MSTAITGRRLRLRDFSLNLIPEATSPRGTHPSGSSFFVASLPRTRGGFVAGSFLLRFIADCSSIVLRFENGIQSKNKRRTNGVQETPPRGGGKGGRREGQGWGKGGIQVGQGWGEEAVEVAGGGFFVVFVGEKVKCQ